MRKVSSGGGWPAIRYTFQKAREAGGLWKLWKAMRSKNACKTCALGMGGQRGGMVNEAGSFPEVCKKSLQAMVADMQGAIQPSFWSTYSVPQLQAFSPRELETCGRLTQPVALRRGEQYYRAITWDDALERICAKLKATPPRETFWYLSGRSSNEAGFLVQLFARVFGTNHISNCSYYCHQASGVGLNNVLGTSVATIVLDDLEHADLVFLIGGNPASNHPRLMTSLKNMRRRGGEVIVINPVVETGLVSFKVPSDPWSLMFGSRIATLYVQPHIGGDLALLLGIAKRIVEMGAIDERFLVDHCHGWSELREHLAGLSWDAITAASGVDRAQIDDMAARYARAKNVVFAWTMGITHHVHGVENVEAIANLALLRGMVGRERAGLLPIRGHSNVQGIGSMGVMPKLKQIVFDRLQQHFGVELPTERGFDTMGCLEAAHEGHFRFAFCLGGNLYGASPDAAFCRDAIAKLDQVVYLSTTLNTGHAHGLADETIILPVLARDEEPEPTTQESMFSYVRLSDGGPARHDGPKSEIEIVTRIAHQVLGDTGPIDWSAMGANNRIRECISRIVPGWEEIAAIDQTKHEFQIGGRTFHTPHFATDDGRAKIRVHSIPSQAVEPDQLRLMTVRSEGQFNTVVYEEYDLYRGQERRDLILLHPDDIARLGLQAEERATVTSAVGRMENVLVRPFDKIRTGSALMYYPEANVLVPRAIDPASRTPAFKNILIRVACAERSSSNGSHNGDNHAGAGAANGEGAAHEWTAEQRAKMRSC